MPHDGISYLDVGQVSYTVGSTWAGHVSHGRTIAYDAHDVMIHTPIAYCWGIIIIITITIAIDIQVVVIIIIATTGIMRTIGA